MKALRILVTVMGIVMGLNLYAQEEAALMVLDKESGLPVCRLSDQVRINSEFIPENRIGDVEATAMEDIRICQEDDVWDAVEEEMLVGMAIGTPNVSIFMITIGASGVVGCAMGILIKLNEPSETTLLLQKFTVVGSLGGVIGALAKVLVLAENLARPVSVGVLSSLVAAEICRRQTNYWERRPRRPLY